MVFELNLYELAHKTHDLFSKDMQNYMKSMSVLWCQIARNDHAHNYVCVYPIEF